MFGTPISERKGLDITINSSSSSSSKKKCYKSVIKLLIFASVLLTTYFLYSFKNPPYELSTNTTDIPVQEDFIAPEALPTNTVEQIGRRSNEFIIERDDNKDDNKDDSKDSSNDDSKDSSDDNNKDDNKDSSNDDNNNDNSNNDDNSDSDDKDDKKKSTPIYNQPGMRFVFVLFGFIFLNMFAICIHHLYLKASNVAYAYKTVDDDISPF